MSDQDSTFFFRWAQTTFGISLARREKIAFINDNILIVGQDGVAKWAAATYDFSPAVMPDDLQAQLKGIHSLMLDDPEMDTPAGSHHIPTWIADLIELKSLALWNADLSGLDVCALLPISYLDLRRARYSSASSLIEKICSMSELELFIHDGSISKDLVAQLKEKMPNVVAVTKEDN